MDILKEIELLDCPLCGGAGVLSEEGGWAFSVQCCDCGACTSHAIYHTPEERLEAAASAARCWNRGKVINPAPGE